MRFISQLQAKEDGEIQIRNTQMLERSTLVDIKAPGGLTFVYTGKKSTCGLTGNTPEIAKT